VIRMEITCNFGNRDPVSIVPTDAGQQPRSEFASRRGCYVACVSLCHPHEPARSLGAGFRIANRHVAHGAGYGFVSNVSLTFAMFMSERTNIVQQVCFRT